MLAANQVLHKGRYRIITQFGQDETGGMYEAYDTVSNTNVVLRESIGKVGKIATATQLEAINAEFAGGARVLSEIKHESLVSVQDYFSEIDRQYLVLESVTGRDLTSFLEPEAKRPALADVMTWADQLLDALQYLHRLGPPVIHHDIKPSNIKLTANLRVKLLATGLPPAPYSDAVTLIPGQSWAKASFSYKPLEQLWGGLDPASQRVILNSYDEKSAGVLLRPLDARSDLYSLAASLYHILTGTTPDDALERSIAILDGKPDPLRKPSDMDEGIPPEVSDTLMRAMAIRRENRYDSAILMQQVLRTALVRMNERKTVERDAVNTRAALTGAETVAFNLKPERSTADDRQHEIETEQARLEEEQERIDERRRELVAERKRLELEAENERKRLERERVEQEAEIERKRVAQKLADLEAERARERAEEERLEREAETERKRAEERLQTIHAEQELHRVEQKHLEAEAKAELIRAEERIREISRSNIDIAGSSDDDHSLLELEPLSAPISSHVSGFRVTDQTGSEKASVHHSSRVRAKEKAVSVDDHATFSLHQEQTGSGKRMFVIAGVALLMIAMAIGIWQFVPSGTAPAATPVQATFSAEQPQRDLETTPPANLPQETAPSSPPAVVPEQEVPVDTGVKEKQPQLNAAQDKQKKPAPAAAKTPAPKKKITVEDLINDN